jgi:hypothetical protein
MHADQPIIGQIHVKSNMHFPSQPCTPQDPEPLTILLTPKGCNSIPFSLKDTH